MLYYNHFYDLNAHGFAWVLGHSIEGDFHFCREQFINYGRFKKKLVVTFPYRKYDHETVLECVRQTIEVFESEWGIEPRTEIKLEVLDGTAKQQPVLHFNLNTFWIYKGHILSLFLLLVRASVSATGRYRKVEDFDSLWNLLTETKSNNAKSLQTCSFVIDQVRKNGVDVLYTKIEERRSNPGISYFNQNLRRRLDAEAD